MKGRTAGWDSTASDHLHRVSRIFLPDLLFSPESWQTIGDHGINNYNDFSFFTWWHE